MKTRNYVADATQLANQILVSNRISEISEKEEIDFFEKISSIPLVEAYKLIKIYLNKFNKLNLSTWIELLENKRTFFSYALHHLRAGYKRNYPDHGITKNPEDEIELQQVLVSYPQPMFQYAVSSNIRLHEEIEEEICKVLRIGNFEPDDERLMLCVLAHLDRGKAKVIKKVIKK